MPMGSPIGKRCPPPRAGARSHLPAASSGYGMRIRKEDGDATECQPRPLAELALGGLEGHVRHAAPVDTDRREDPPGPESLDQPLVARHPLRDRARADDV